MHRPFLWTLTVLSLFTAPLGQEPTRVADQGDSQIATSLADHQYNLQREGRRFLLDEADKNTFFLLGELHGDSEIPDLLRTLWPEMWKKGYRHVAAEISPWAAHQLEFVPAGKGPEVRGLWTKREAEDVHAPGNPGASVLWGCDMEEEQPEFLIRELATLNPADSNLKQMTQLTKDGYSRKLGPKLLELAKASKGMADGPLSDVSLRESLLATLDIENDRRGPDTKMSAQDKRERLMKQQFLTHFHHDSSPEASKVLLRFGRNHLHRGYDARGISTLGNFIAEFAVAEGRSVFNVGAFGAGGKASLLGETWDADERQDEPAFALLAGSARYSATIFDLRPLRPLLHQIPQEKRTALQANLIYWADSYDALICYKNVTPREP